MSLGKSFITPALAAVSLAAAFVVYSVSSPLSAESTDTTVTTFIDSQLDIVSAEYGDSMANPDGAEQAVISFAFIAPWAMNYTTNSIVGYMVVDSPEGTDGNFTGTAYYVNNGQKVTTEAALSIGDTYVRFNQWTFSYTYSDMGSYCAMLSVPSGKNGGVGQQLAAKYPLYSSKMTYANAPVGVAFRHSSPTVAGVLRESKSAVKAGNSAYTTTSTSTTTTTTTVTTATLPPFPYETAPPFELPSDWTADYQETAPAPDVGDFSVTTPAEVTAPDVPAEVTQGVGFWFTLFTDLIQRFSLAWVVLLTVTVGFIIYMIWGR